MEYLTLYDNATCLPLGASKPCDARYLGQPDQVAGGCKIYKVGDVRCVVTPTPLLRNDDE